MSHTPDSRPHGPPTAGELLEAVRELLQGSVLDVVSGRVRYEVRVAINVLAMVERELSLGPEQAEQHAAQLAALGYASDGELAAAIRSGTADVDDRAVLEVIRDGVRRKLEVANPGYLAT